MVTVLEDLSAGLAARVAELGASVVRVDARRRLPSSGVVWSDDGLIVTTSHTIEREDGIELGLPDGSKVPGRLIGRDPTTDTALIRTDASGLAVPSWKGPEALRVGHLLLGVARPGSQPQATLGIVSALGPSWRTPAGGKIDTYLQSDLVMSPGFSGGGLVTATGDVVGIITSGLARGTTLAVPMPTLESVVGSLLAHGRVRRGYLGIGTHPVRFPQALAATAGQETGLLIESIASGSPADSAGLLLGDILLAMDGEALGSVDDLLGLLSEGRAGKKVGAKLIRGGKVMETSLVVGERE